MNHKVVVLGTILLYEISTNRKYKIVHILFDSRRLIEIVSVSAHLNSTGQTPKEPMDKIKCDRRARYANQVDKYWRKKLYE